MTMRRTSKIVLGVVVVLLCVPMVVSAAPPNKYIGYTGFLAVYDSGNNVYIPVDGQMNLTFKIYAVPAGGTAIWADDFTDVWVKDGEFEVQLGSQKSLDYDGVDADEDPDLNFLSSNQYYLEVLVGGSPMDPRKEILFVPYAITSESVVVEVRTDEPGSPVEGQMWLITNP